VAGPPVVHVVGGSWSFRALLRGELRERGIEALGFETLDDSLREAAAAPPAVVAYDGRGAGEAALRRAAGAWGGASLLVVLARAEEAAARRAGVPETALLPVSIGALAARLLALLPDSLPPRARGEHEDG